MELAQTGCMKAGLLALLLILTSVSAFAQQTTVAPGDIRCPDCSLTGQQPAVTESDPSQTAFVANPIPAFHENQTFRIRLVARVLNAAPLMLDVLNARFQMVDRSMKVVDTGREDREPATCQGPQRMPIVDLASKPVVETLRLNDIITGDIMMQRSEKMPDAILMATQVFTNVRKASGPVPLVATASAKRCANHSGVLIEYWTGSNGKTTIVYNDGGVFHRNAALLSFDQQKLAPAELSDLLRSFNDANFDSVPTEFPQKDSSSRPSLTLIGTRYQRVALKDGDPLLAPLVKRLDALADRSMSQARYILKRDDPIPLDVRPWPYAEVDLEKLMDPRNTSSSTAPQAWAQQVPKALLASLPGDGTTGDDPRRDPNRTVHFSHAERIYRVARSISCAASSVCQFRMLSVAQVAEPASGECTLGMLKCVTQIFPDGRRVTTRVDSDLTRKSGRLWPRALGVRLRDVPSEGMTITKDEYDRHNEIYFPLLQWRMLGAPFIEDGLLYDHVRVCQIDKGADATCEITPPWTPPAK
jgi:hypothetical protein